MGHFLGLSLFDSFFSFGRRWWSLPSSLFTPPFNLYFRFPPHVPFVWLGTCFLSCVSTFFHLLIPLSSFLVSGRQRSFVLPRFATYRQPCPVLILGQHQKSDPCIGHPWFFARFPIEAKPWTNKKKKKQRSRGDAMSGTPCVCVCVVLFLVVPPILSSPPSQLRKVRSVVRDNDDARARASLRGRYPIFVSF